MTDHRSDRGLDRRRDPIFVGYLPTPTRDRWFLGRSIPILLVVVAIIAAAIIIPTTAAVIVAAAAISATHTEPAAPVIPSRRPSARIAALTSPTVVGTHCVREKVVRS